MPRKKSPIVDEILDLRTRLAEWRRSHPKRSRLPEGIWTAAVELARRHGLYRTARGLPIDYAGLRQRLEGTRSTALSRPEFLERLSPPTQSSGCVERMRVR